MASPGVGYKTAADVLMEISCHLIEQVVQTTIVTVVGPGGYGTGGYGQYGYGGGSPEVIKPASTIAMYDGALIVVGWGLDTAEVVTILHVTLTGYIYTTAFVNVHGAGETILSPTFPTQQPTDPFFTQQEMLGYLARAQNEFLSACPVYFELVQQTLIFGQIFQNTPDNCIELSRVAASQFFAQIATITRSGDSVLLVTTNPHGLQVGSTFFVQNGTDGFGGVFEALTVPTPSSLTYEQIADDGTATGGSVLYFSRLYETTSAELTMSDRNWRNKYANSPSAYFEDRSGLYMWGVSAKPSSNFPVELLMGIRDTDTLGLLDGFLVPDMLTYIVKYGALAYIFSKDGVQQDPTRAAYCRQRFEKGIVAVNRYIDGFTMGMKAGK